MPEAPHPDAVRMAEVMLEARESNGACQFRDLMRAGFSGAQVTEHFPVAERLATGRSIRRVDIRPGQGARGDTVGAVLIKTRSPWPNRPPAMAGTDEQALHDAWGVYCASRSALKLDPWPGQRERALDKLADCLRFLPLMPQERARILHETGRHLANTAQTTMFSGAMRPDMAERILSIAGHA